VNALGYLRVMFAVDDLDETLARLGEHGAQLVGDVVQYRDAYRLCYIRGPEGLLIGLAEELDPYPALTETATVLADGLSERFTARGEPVTVNRAGSMLSLFFSAGPVHDFADAKASNHQRYARFFHHLLDRGVWLPPSGYELWTLGTEHGPNEIDRVLEASGTFEG